MNSETLPQRLKVTSHRVLMTPMRSRNSMQRSSLPSRVRTRSQSHQASRCLTFQRSSVRDVSEDTEFSDLCKQYWDQTDFSDLDEEQRKGLKAYLSTYIAAQARAGNFQDARIAQKMAIALEEPLPPQERKQVSMEEVERATENEDKRHQEELERIEQRYKEKTENLEETQNNRKEEFELLWSDQKLRSYTKPSAQLLNLIQIEQTMASQVNIDGAETIHREVMEMAKEESATAQERITEDYEYASQRLQEQNAKERAVLEQKKREDIDREETRHKKELDSIEKRSCVLKARPVFVHKDTQPTILFTTGVPKRQDREIFKLDVVAPNSQETKGRKKPEKVKISRRTDASSLGGLFEATAANIVVEPSTPEESEETREIQEVKGDEQSSPSNKKRHHHRHKNAEENS